MSLLSLSLSFLNFLTKLKRTREFFFSSFGTKFLMSPQQREFRTPVFFSFSRQSLFSVVRHNHSYSLCPFCIVSIRESRSLVLPVSFLRLRCCFPSSFLSFLFSFFSADHSKRSIFSLFHSLFLFFNSFHPVLSCRVWTEKKRWQSGGAARMRRAEKATLTLYPACTANTWALTQQTRRDREKTFGDHY